MKKYLLVLAGCIVLGLIVSRLTIWKPADSTTSDLIIVTRMDLAQEVAVTGRVKTAKDLSLAFAKTGRITSVRVDIGSRVDTGDILASLDQGEIVAQISQAEANVAVEKAKLEDLRNGVRVEEIAVQEARVRGAESTVRNTQNALSDSMNSSFTTADDAVHSKADSMLSNGRTSNPQLAFTVDPQMASGIVQARIAAETALNNWPTLLPAPNDTSDVVLYKSELVKKNLLLIATLLDKLALALNQVAQTGSVTASTLTAWKSDISTARTNVQAAISAVSTDEDSVRSARATLTIEERTLALDKAATPQSKILAQESTLISAEAKVTQLRSALADTVMRSPASGIVSLVDAKVGEIAGANAPLIRVVSVNAYDIEANIPETDVGSIALSNTVIITLDAFPGETFMGKVILIDPAETIIDGVVNFKTTVRFDKPDARVKSGMTANLRVQTITKKQVLSLPQYAILENDAGKFVRLVDTTMQKGYREVPIQTGIRSPEGFVEIISGVGDGDKVLNIGIKND